jgi:DNA-binding transcriptional ArsR family regulator
MLPTTSTAGSASRPAAAASGPAGSCWASFDSRSAIRRRGSRDYHANGDTGLHEYTKGCTVAGVETVTHGQVLARFGHALSDPTRARLLLALRDAPAHPAELADLLGVTRQNLSNHLACLRGCGLVVAVPEGRRTRYELADTRLRHALGDLLGLVLAVDPAACPDAADKDCC